MKIITYLSNLIIPPLLFYIIASGLLAKQDIYQDFLDGARDGLKTVVSICPTLIGLMTAVGVLRASGFLTFLSNLLGKATTHLGLPGDIIPLTLIRLFSSSAATSLLLDIFKEHGTESPTALMSAIILSSTESVFYCMSVYFGITKVKKTRYTLPGALLATAVGMAVAVWIVIWDIG
ncbi:spore maturation protein [Blautia sp. Sow4_E7]|uniref:spore maturation protein n=1 Tax=Blautia sp. Sow4_E7 TaxID=3438749 RepID=UPI003F8DA522